MAELEVKEQCKKCFHFQVCANVLKQQLYIREKMLKEENPKCDNFVPAADVVEVVRCKDCIQRRYHCFGQYYCQRYLFKCKENDYCSYGDKKEGV